jgi:hypothetical protein
LKTLHVDLNAVLPLPPEGLYVQADLQALINEVYVAPNAAPWFADLVKSVMERYERPEPVVQSSLASDPLYYRFVLDIQTYLWRSQVQRKDIHDVVTELEKITVALQRPSRLGE